jgi:hypothetical protein
MWMIRPSVFPFAEPGACEHHTSAEIEFNDAVPILIFHWSMGLGTLVPALFTRMSTRPICSSAVLARRSASLRLDKST